MKPPGFSISIFLMLLSIFAVSLCMFAVLVRRWTTQRQWVSLSEWARQRKFSRRAGNDEALAKMKSLLNGEFEVLLQLSGAKVFSMQFQTPPPPGMQMSNRWNVLMRKRMRVLHLTAALRPTSASASLLDLFGLSNFPSVTVGARFTVLATSSSAARSLSDSASRTLVPADIGLLVSEDWLLLDFSSRPFDPIELDRMLALGEQLDQRL